MKVNSYLCLLEIFFLFEDICKASAAEKGIIYGVWDPSGLTNLPEIPNSPSQFNYNTFSLNGYIRSITVDERRNVTFVSLSSDIIAIHNYSTTQSNYYTILKEFQGKSDDSGEIAFDYLSNNLFWCDSRLNWVAMKSAYTGNASLYKVLVQENLHRPEGLILDPLDGLIFFSDNKPNGRITRASMNGENATVIVFSGLVHVPSLSNDPHNKLLYWTDVIRETLEVCEYDGTNRRVIRRSNGTPFTGIQYYQNALHVVSFERKLIRGVDVFSGILNYNVKLTTGTPVTVTVFDSENIPNLRDPCSSRLCEQICVNTQSGPSCMCYEGYDLAFDGNSCIDKSPFHGKGFIISYKNKFEIINIVATSGILEPSPAFEDTSACIQSFAVDVSKEIIYYIDSNNEVLKELNMDNLEIRELVSVRGGRDLIFDWHRHFLGWIDTDASNIVLFNLKSQEFATIYSSIKDSKSLTVDPQDGILFWISSTSPASILSGSWEGLPPRPLVTSDHSINVRELNYDVTTLRLYWMEGLMVKSCLKNGLDVKTHNLAIDATYAFSYKNFYVWVKGSILYSGLKHTNFDQKSVSISENATGVAIFDTVLQRNLTGTCEIANGECEQICLPGKNGHTCECDFGLQLQNDSRTCNSSVLDTNFVLVTDSTHSRIIQIDFYTGEVVKLPIKATGAAGIAFDKSTNTVFFTSSSYAFSSKVMSVPLQTSGNIVTYATGFDFSESVAIDYSSGNLYFSVVTSSGQDSIKVVKQKSFEQRTILTNLNYPRGIALYSSKGLVFWVEIGVPRIGRAYMDGTSKQYIVTSDIPWPNGVAIDYTDERLYWVEGNRDYIESSDLNGGDRRLIATDIFTHMWSLFVHGDFIYYTGFKRQRVVKISKNTGTKKEFMNNYPELGVLGEVFVYTENDKMDVSQHCMNRNGLCSTFCFPTPSGRTCGCQDNVKLLSDQKTCEGVSMCSTSRPNIKFINCPPYSGESCEFQCEPGFRETVNRSVTCNALGEWEPDISTLCIEVLCPFFLPNAVLDSGCSRKIGESCGFICKENYISTSANSIMCSSYGQWIKVTDSLCLEMETDSSSVLVVALSLAIGFAVLLNITSLIFCLYKRDKDKKKLHLNMKKRALPSIENVVENRNLRRESTISEHYSTLPDWNASDYGHTNNRENYPSVSVVSMTGESEIVSEEYIDPISEKREVNDNTDTSSQ